MATCIKKNRRNLASIFAEILCPIGFARNGRFFVREKSECFQIVDIQGSRYGEGTFINQTVWFKALGPYPGGEGAFHFSARMESLVQNEEPHWQEVLKASEESINKQEWKDEINRLLHARLPVFDLVSSPTIALDSERNGLLIGSYLASGLLADQAV